MRALHSQAFEAIKKDVSVLKDNKVSHMDLAEVLFEIYLKVKGSEFVPTVAETTEPPVKTEFFLPEQQAEG